MTGIAMEHLARGQTNFLRSVFKLNSVYDPKLLLADHARPVVYEIPQQPERRDGPAHLRRELYVHAPRGRASRAIDAATERFVDETRIGATP
jgi:hypothetical protein